MTALAEYDLIALGIDQGIANVGYAVTGMKDGQEFILRSGTLNTTTKLGFQERIETIYEFINDLLNTYNVDVMGMEKLFFNPAQKLGRNKSADIMRTNMVTGVLFLLASQHKKVIWDYTPGTVKKFVAGHGQAPKELVEAHVKSLAERSGISISTEHEADAIAISLTALKEFLVGRAPKKPKPLKKKVEVRFRKRRKREDIPG